MDILFVATLVAFSASAPVHSNYAWRLDNKLGVCGLAQEVPSGGTLEISRRIGAGTTFVSFENGDSDREPSIEATDAGVSLTPEGQFSGTGHFKRRSTTSPNWISLEIADPSFLSKFGGAATITLAHRAFGQLTIPVRSTAAAARALIGCEEKRLREWGIDPASWNGLRSRPQPLTPPSSWLSSDYYPFQALNFGVDAGVLALLTVGPDGTVQNCKGLITGVPEDFNLRTCYGLKRKARFKPALDANGVPTTAPYIIAVRYEMQRGIAPN